MKKVLLFSLSLVITQSSVAKTALVFGGKTGWIGQKIVTLLTEAGDNAICACARLENREEIIAEIKQYSPDFIVNAAGITGRPNVDWCETNKQETIRTNVLGILNLVDIAYLYNINVTNFSTGCIYTYDEQHSAYSGIGFTEKDAPNFTDSFYSKSKVWLENITTCYPNLLNLRIKMPICSDMHPRSFVGKIINYKKVVNIPTSASVLDDLLPISIDMMKKGLTGTYNFVNPGHITHNEILALYKKYLNPDFTWENFTEEEQNKILKVKRAHSELDATKLLTLYPNIPTIHDSLTKLFENISKN